MRHRLGEYLVHAGLITDEALRRALEEQKRTGDRLGMILARMKLASEEQIARTLAVQLGFPYVDLDEDPPNPAAAQLISKDLAVEHLCIPISAQKDVLTVAMADPLLFSLVQDLEFQTGYRIRQVVATGGDILRSIQTCYPDHAPESVSSHREAPEPSTSGVAGPQDASDVANLTDRLLTNAAALNAAAIHIDPLEHGGVVRYRLDGVLTPVQDLAAGVHEAVIDRVKAAAGLDVDERRLPQDGRLRITGSGGAPVDLRVSTLRTLLGEKLVLRALERRAASPAIETLGLPATALDELRRSLERHRGLVIIAGPAPSGRTTTFYAALTALRSEHTSIVAIEDPIECEIPGVSQVDVSDGVDRTYAGALRSMLRQDADVIGIGELRDADVATLAIDAARASTLVIGVMQADDAAGAVARLMHAVADPSAVASALVAVLAQRLVRRLCTSCRRPFTPAPDVLALMGVSAVEAGALVFYEAAGCDQCNHTGYRGRVGVYEVLRVGDRIRRLVASRAPEDQIRAAATSAGMVTLGEDALSKVKTGITTVPEIARVLGDLQDVRAVCAICGALVSADYAACPLCGTRLGSPCPHCGRTLQPGWNFCPYCARSAGPTGS